MRESLPIRIRPGTASDRVPLLDISGLLTWGDQRSSYAFTAVHALVLLYESFKPLCGGYNSPIQACP